MRLPPDARLRNKTAAPTGWYAYYADAESRSVLMLPVVLWVTVEYEELVECQECERERSDDYDYDEDDEPLTDLVQEIRPFVLSRSGRVLEAQEPDADFLCILGPGVEHTAVVSRALQLKYPDLTWEGEVSPTAN